MTKKIPAVKGRTQKNNRSDMLKLIAIVTMLIDHIGVLLFPDMRILRTIGRIAFPIFAWLLVQGFLHTSNRKKYGFRLFCFALVAEMPYAFLNRDMTYESEHYNVMYLLCLGLILLIVVEKSGQLLRDKRLVLGLSVGLLGIVILAFPDVIQYYNPDFALSYGTYGLVMMLIFYYTRHYPVVMVMAYVALSFIEPYRTGVYYRALYMSPDMSYMEAFKSYGLIWNQIIEYKDGLRKLEGYFFQARSMLGLLFIVVFNRVHVKVRLPRYVAYVFYPLHISILLAIRIINGGPLG